VQLTASDTSGLHATISKQIQVVGPPTAAFNTVTSPPLAGSPVSFDGTASSDPNSGGSVSSYSWSFGDGATGTGATASHTYASPGTYTVQLTVTDSFGLVSSTISKQVQVFVPPSAAFTLSPTSPVSGHPVAFKGTTSSDPNSGGSISSYSWSFGDGGTASGAAPSHTYREKGTYTVKLTVTDNFGISTSVSRRVTVRAAGPPTPSHASLSGVGNGKPKLAFHLAAGANAPSLKQVVIALPSGLSFKSKGLAKGLSVKAPGAKKLSFTERLHQGKLTITLKRAARDVQVTIGGAAITVSEAVEHTANHHKRATVKVPVTAVDSSGRQTKLTLKLPV
jgi:PKD repeat protein